MYTGSVYYIAKSVILYDNGCDHVGVVTAPPPIPYWEAILCQAVLHSAGRDEGDVLTVNHH